MGNKSKVTIARAILIYSIMRGEEVGAEDIIADNIAVIAQGLQSKGNLGFPSTIYKLCKDAGVPLNAEKGRPMLYGCLKSDFGAGSSSQADPQESVPLWTAPPILDFQPPHPPPN
ncbi:hypothetical protein PIB30_094095 [Stylosanthes scabra]|uniref:Putative plant transposon protein domain-containing protein n=1 Tax=Stylosanthes scabra TaxID=79078 RepID=A0ABU6XUM8_9FABA|nr:hypothetical protein [Stylosanthes scabra]